MIWLIDPKTLSAMSRSKTTHQQNCCWLTVVAGSQCSVQSATVVAVVVVAKVVLVAHSKKTQ
jgi:hypothetical protein